MREVKFRAFCKKDKEMYYNIQKGITFSDESHYRFENFLKKQADDYHEYEVMQYTGLKDKNGKRIYEGDVVVSTKGEFQVSGVVKYNTPSFEVVDDNDKWIEILQKNIEVIGNIYEHASLLKHQGKIIEKI